MKKLVTSIDNLLIPVKIGTSAPERSKTQDIKVSIDIFQSKIPKPDVINKEYICYAELAEEIKILASSKEFILIEELCSEIFQLTKTKAKTLTIKVCVEKTINVAGATNVKARARISE